MDQSCNEQNFLDPLLHFVVFVLQWLSTAVENRACAAHTFDLAIFLLFLHVVFPAFTAVLFRISGSLDFEYFFTSFFFAVSWLMDLKYWDCLHIRFLYSLILFYLCFFRFSSILLDSQWQKKDFPFFQLNFFTLFSVLGWSSKVWRN